jgi:hypothetical protein
MSSETQAEARAELAQLREKADHVYLMKQAINDQEMYWKGIVIKQAERIAALEQAGGELYRIWKSLEPGLDIAIPKNNLLRIAARMEIDHSIKAWEALAAHPAPEAKEVK